MFQCWQFEQYRLVKRQLNSPLGLSSDSRVADRFCFLQSPSHERITVSRDNTRRHERLFTTALGPETGPRTTRIPWRRTPRPARRGRWRRTSWSRKKPAANTAIRRRMIRTSTTTTSGHRLRPASVGMSTPTTTTRSACLCSRRPTTSSRAPRCRPRRSVHPAGDARAVPWRACRCSFSARRRRHPARAPPVSKTSCQFVLSVCRRAPHCARIVIRWFVVVIFCTNVVQKL